MQAILYSQARNNLRQIINQVCDDYDEVVITTKDDKSVILISYEEYRSIKETMYLLSSKNNRERLLDSIEEIDNAQLIKKDLYL